MTKLIYALTCPITNKIHYVGKTEVGLTRPFKHLTDSHNQKIRDWVEDLKIINHKPSVIVLENVSIEDDISIRERYWVNKCLNEGALLLNIDLVSNETINPLLEYESPKSINIDEISYFVKTKRKSLGLKQIEFADKVGVALTVLRKIEQGKLNVNLDGLLNVLNMLGVKLSIKKNK